MWAFDGKVINEENEHAENLSEKLAPPARFVRARYFLRRLRKRVPPFAAIGFVFICLALIQHWFVHAKVYSTISQELASWAADVAEPIAYRNKWDLTAYRNASPPVPSWFVVSEDGLIIDIEGGFIPGLFGKVELLVTASVSDLA